MSNTTLIRSQEKELSRLKRGNKKKLIRMCVGLTLMIVFFYVVPASHNTKPGARSSVSTLAADYVSSRNSYIEWLTDRGTSSELLLFQIFTDGFHQEILSLAHEANSGISRIVIQVYAGLQRISFVLVAALRLWVVLIMGAVWIGLRRFAPYRSSDLLGQTGNDRLFYSGIRAALSSSSPDSVPDQLIQGLACPKMVSDEQVRKEKSFSLLRQHGLDTETNIMLLRMIYAYPDRPGFIKSAEDTSKSVSLPEYTLNAVSTVLKTYRELFPDTLKSKGEIDGCIKPLSEGLKRVLTPSLYEAMKECTVYETVTASLSLEAGKILAFNTEGNKWVQSSNFPQLCARAILHSIPAFTSDFNREQRTRIRHSLLYGARFSPLGPVRLPVDLTPAARALRQWVELLLASPYHLPEVIEEVELYGLTVECFAGYEHHLKRNLKKQSAPDGSVATETGLVFIPMTTLVKDFKKLLSESTLLRLHDLVRTVGERHQKIIHDQEAALVDSPRGGPLPQFQRILPPPNPKQLDELAKQIECSLAELRDWLALRSIFHLYGWLARRVGNASVPEYSCAYTIFFQFDGKDRVARTCMVPLRGSWFEDELGKFWRSYFPTALRAAIAETREHRDKILSGKEDLFEEMSDGAELQ